MSSLGQTHSIKNADTVDGKHATTTPTASSIPVAVSGTTIASGWIPALEYVSGAGTVADNSVARFNLTSGKSIQPSNVLIQDSGDMYAGSYIVANNGLNYEVTLGADATHGSIRIGKLSGSSGRSPLIDFHANGTAYADGRIVVSGGAAGAHYGGNLNIKAATTIIDGTIVYKTRNTGVWSTYASTVTGYTTAPSLTLTYCTIGNICYIAAGIVDGSNSNSTSLTFGLPIAATQPINYITTGYSIDNGVIKDSPMGYINISGSTATCYRSFYQNGWTNTSRKALFFQGFFYSIS